MRPKRVVTYVYYLYKERARARPKENAFFLHFFAKKFGHIKKKQYFCTRFRLRERNDPSFRVKKIAEIAQLVEHDLAKVGVASSSLVFRSFFLPRWRNW